MDFGLESGYYIFTTAGTLSEIGATRFATSEEADTKLKELNSPSLAVRYIPPITFEQPVIE